MGALPEQLARPAGRIRQSFAARFDECPHAAWLGSQYDAHGHQLGRGLVLHDFACRTVARCAARGVTQLPVEEGRDLMRELIAHTDEPITGTEHDTLMLLAYQFCTGHTFDPDAIADLEAEYSVEIAGEVQLRPGQHKTPFAVTLHGRPDLLAVYGDRCEVRDYKTAWGVDPESGIAGTFQGRFYGVLALTALPAVEQVDLIWDYVRWGERGERRAALYRSQLPELLDYLRGLAARIVRARAREKWPAVPGSWCARCPAAQLCPLPEAERRDGAPIDRAMAAAYAAQALALEARLKQRKKQLRAWVAEHGPIEMGDGEYTLELGPDVLRVDEKARERMDEAGVSWEPFASTVKGSTKFTFRRREEPA